MPSLAVYANLNNRGCRDAGPSIRGGYPACLRVISGQWLSRGANRRKA